MARSATEARHPQSDGLELRNDGDLLKLLWQGQIDALQAVASAIPALESAAALFVETIRAGCKIVYCGAGSSGLIALVDAVELPGTFGIDSAQIAICLAGGLRDLSRIDSAAEDNDLAAGKDLGAVGVSAGDCLIAVSASGTTRFTLSAVRQAKLTGMKIIGLACNAGTPLLALADCPVLLETSAELVSGSTRMGAGTAQKAALNMISTLAAMRLGFSMDGQMVNLRIDNAKLRQRAIGVVASLGRCMEKDAARYLSAASDNIKIAIMLARGADSVQSAAEQLLACKQDVRQAIEALVSAK